MRRINSLLGMMAMVAASAMPAVAASPHASCQGAAHSNQTEPGAAGDFHSALGQQGFNGVIASSTAQFGPQGQDRSTTGGLGSNFEFCMNPS